MHCVADYFECLSGALCCIVEPALVLLFAAHLCALEQNLEPGKKKLAINPLGFHPTPW